MRSLRCGSRSADQADPVLTGQDGEPIASTWLVWISTACMNASPNNPEIPRQKEGSPQPKTLLPLSSKVVNKQKVLCPSVQKGKGKSASIVKVKETLHKGVRESVKEKPCKREST